MSCGNKRQDSIVELRGISPTKAQAKTSSLEGAELYSVLTDSVVCSQDYHAKGRMNCAKTPFCCYGWGDFSKKKEGIYKRGPGDLITKLGKDPKERKRKTLHHKSEDLRPVGLKNLGATCYLNVLIQINRGK